MGISQKAFRDLTKRLSGQGNSRLSDCLPSLDFALPLRILGIDPSLRATGFGIIEAHRKGVIYVDSGTIHCPSHWLHSKCLLAISEALTKLLQNHRPKACAIEGLFFAKNSKTALVMGQVRGACLVSVSKLGIPIYEIAPKKVKQAIVGFGNAQKIAVAKMIQRMLALKETPSSDAGDALALAMTLTFESSSPLVRPNLI